MDNPAVGIHRAALTRAQCYRQFALTLRVNEGEELPSNLNADYSVDNLYEFLSGYELPRDPGSEFEYSNLGAGLLGHLLACRAGTDYESLIRTRITRPLGMLNTGITLSSSMK